MQHSHEICIPRASDILLIGGLWVAVVHVEHGIYARRQVGAVYAAHKVSIGGIEAFDFVIEFRQSIG